MKERASVARRVPAALTASTLLACAISVPAWVDSGVRVVASIKPVHSLVSAVMAGVGEPHLIIRVQARPTTSACVRPMPRCWRKPQSYY